MFQFWHDDWEVRNVYQFWFFRFKESATIGTLTGRTTHRLSFPPLKTVSESRIFMVALSREEKLANNEEYLDTEIELWM